MPWCTAPRDRHGRMILAMHPPEQDVTGRQPIWDALQVFWMDTDPGIDLEAVAHTCAHSKYSLADIEQIFWNEVRPAVEFNLHSLAGEWAGFEIAWLTQRILATHRFGKRLPGRYVDGQATYWWKRLADCIRREYPSHQ